MFKNKDRVMSDLDLNRCMEIDFKVKLTKLRNHFPSSKNLVLEAIAIETGVSFDRLIHVYEDIRIADEEYVLYYRFYKGLSVEATSEILGVCKTTILNRSKTGAFKQYEFSNAYYIELSKVNILLG